MNGWGIGGSVGTVLGAGLGAWIAGSKARWEGAGIGAVVGGAAGTLIGGGVEVSGVLTKATPAAQLGSGPASRAVCVPYVPRAGDSILLVGDSIGQGIAPELQKAINAKWPNVAFVSAAAKSETARTALNRIKGLSFSGLAIVSLGSNDAAGAVDAEASQVQSLIDQLAMAGARIVWVPGPNFALATPPAPATKASQKTFSAQVQKDPRPELFTPSPSVVNHLAADKVHLDPDGYALLAKEILTCIGAT